MRAIVSSGYSDDTVMANFSEYGFKAVLPKPYTIDEMSKTLRGVMNQKGGESILKVDQAFLGNLTEEDDFILPYPSS